MTTEAPEITRAKDQFERSVAVSIASMAVVLAFIGDRADDAKTEALLRTTEATNAWSYFQAKSTKQHVTESALDQLEVLEPNGSEAARAKLKADVARYEHEKNEIREKAEALAGQASEARLVDERAGQGGLLLQLAIVLASVSILARWTKLWMLSLMVAVIGASVGISSWLM